MTKSSLIRSVSLKRQVLVLFAGFAMHHSIAGMYDSSRPVTLDGVIKEFRFINPHPFVMIDAKATMIAERLDEELHADTHRDLDAMRRGAVRTRLLVETLLHDACSQGRELRRRRIDLNFVLPECLTLLAPEVRSRGAAVQVAELPNVDGDEPLISAVFSNLLINALKYGPRSRGKILVDATPEKTGWRFSVQSQGATISVADRDRIFEPYHRGRGERRARGAGLGLTICRNIVERHGGQIGVTSSSSGGNRFYFTLPA